MLENIIFFSLIFLLILRPLSTALQRPQNQHWPHPCTPFFSQEGLEGPKKKKNTEAICYSWTYIQTLYTCVFFAGVIFYFV